MHCCFSTSTVTDCSDVTRWLPTTGNARSLTVEGIVRMTTTGDGDGRCQRFTRCSETDCPDISKRPQIVHVLCTCQPIMVLCSLLEPRVRAVSAHI